MEFRKVWRNLTYDKNADFFENKIITVPNIITFGGILLTVSYALLYLTRTWEFLIPVVILLIGFSDFLDGVLARLLNQVSTFGKFLDPLRDRIMLIAVLVNIALFIEGVNYIILSLVIITECGIVLINGIAKFKYQLYVQAHWVGKLRLLVHMISAGIFSLTLYWPNFNSKLTDIDPNLLLFIMLTASIFTAGKYLSNLISSFNK